MTSKLEKLWFLHRLLASLVLTVGIAGTAMAQDHPGPVVGSSSWQPEQSNRMLLVALGTPEAPAIDADDPIWRARLAAGWTLQHLALEPTAGVAESAAAVAELVEKTDSEHGPFRYRVLHTAGALAPVALELVENPTLAKGLHGALIFNGQFEVAATSRRPLRPLFLISHRDQLAAPLAYLASASGSFAQHSVAVHVIDRHAADGFLPAERQRSLIFTYNWVSGEIPARLGNATYDPPAPVGSGTLTERAVTLDVVSLEVDFGNLEFDATFDALAPLEVKLGDVVAVRAGEEVRFARVTDRFDGVPRGDWGLVVIPSGELRASIYVGNASEDIGVTPGGTVEIVEVIAE
ncbi:MAG: hypothetical protein JJT88_15720 [Gammaproteobacteria bacterium]|nr:hypothetical protein [Gammaproteobacteria bacterium]